MHWLMAAACNSQSTNPYNISASDIGIPCSSTPDLGSAVAHAVALLMALMGGLALLFIVVGGLQYVLSAGNPQRASRARETILYASIGLGVAIAGYAIVAFIIGVPNGTY